MSIGVQCSSTPVIAFYSKAKVLPFSNLISYEDGPVYIQDTSMGLGHQIWRGRLVGDTFYLTSPTTPETAIMTVRGITEISFTFDQNGRYVVAYLVGSVLWLYWFDPAVNEFIHTPLDSDVISPRISLDDYRPLLLSSSNIILAYVKNNNLYCRVQEDRYQIPFLVEEDIGGRLMRIGMNINFRFQYVFQALPYEDYSCTVGLNCL